MNNIFLIGFMGTGKSTVAQALQEVTGREIIEMDQELEKLANMTINDIFAKHGEDYFRDLESKLVLEISKQDEKIVSCGGGAVLREENRKYMKESGKIVLLTATPKTVYERIKDFNDRPLLAGNMNEEYIASLMEKRRDLYEAAKDVTVATDGKTTRAIGEEILDKIRA